MTGGAGINYLHHDRDARWITAAAVESSCVLYSEAGRFVTLSFGVGARRSNVMVIEWFTLCFVAVKYIRTRNANNLVHFSKWVFVGRGIDR